MSELLVDLDALGRAVPGWLLAITLWTGALWLAARLLDALLRRRVAAAWRLPLYAAVLVRLWLPAQWHSPLSVWPSASEPALGVAAAGESVLAAPPAPVLIGSSGELASSSMATSPSSSSPSSWPTLGWGALVLLTWGLGAALLLGRLAVHHRRLSRLAAASRPAPSGVADRSGRVRVLVHDGAGPLAFGVRRPTIVLPAALVHGDPGVMRCVLAHERAHLHRRDPLVVLVLGLVTAIAWPVLPLWLTAARVRSLLELAADERAAHAEGWREYGRVMIDLAARPHHEPSAALGLFGHLRERVGALRPGPRLPAALQVGLGLALPATILACAGVGEPRVDEPSAFAERCEQQARMLAEVPAELTEARAVALFTLARRYEEAQSVEATTAACHDAARDGLVKAATEWHDASEQRNDERLRELAGQAYERYVALFPDDPDAYELQYYYGELLWARAVGAYDRGESSSALFMRSSEEFVELLERDPRGKHAQDAAYAQMLATANAVGEPAPHRPADGKLEPIPYGPAAIALRDSYRRYFEHAPDHGLDVGRAAHGWGQLAMRHNHFDEARPWLERAIDELDAADETRELAVSAAEMLVDERTIAWNREGDTAEQRAEAARELRALLTELPERALWAEPSASRLRSAAGLLLAGIDWKDAMAQFEAGEYPRCGETYERLLAEYPEHPKRADLRANAIACFEAAGDRSRVRALRDAAAGGGR